MSEGFISDGNIQGEEIGEAGATPELAGALEAILKLAALGFNAPEPTGPPRSAAAW